MMKKIFLIFLVLLISARDHYGQTSELDSLKNVAQTHANDTLRLRTYNRIFAATYYSFPDTARFYAFQKLALANEIRYLAQQEEAYKYIGITYSVQGLLDSSMHYYQKSLAISTELGDSLAMCYTIHNIAYAQWMQGAYENSLSNYFKSLEIKHLLAKRTAISLSELKLGGSYENIGIVYSNLNDSLTAYHYYLKAKKAYTDAGDQYGLGTVTSNIGTYFASILNYDSAMIYFNSSLIAFEKSGNLYGESVIYNNKASAFFNHYKNYDSAAYYYKKSLQIRTQMNDMRGIAYIKIELAPVLSKLGKFNEAQTMLMEGRKLAEELQLTAEIANSYSGLSFILEDKGDYLGALQNFRIFYQKQMDLMSLERKKNIDELETKFETAEKEREIARLNAETALQKIELLEKRNLLIMAAIGIVFLIIIALVQYQMVKLKNRTNLLLGQKNNEIQAQKEEIVAQSEALKSANDALADKNEELNQQNEEIASQRDRLESQNEFIAQINLDLTDSIHYARQIQEAMLPSIADMQTRLPGLFIFFKPRDIVSGDFYWFYKQADVYIVVIADCTGHGVPGAFMSMLGNNLLHDTVVGKQISDPALILTELNLGIKRVLKQESTTNRDGMDMSICTIDSKNQRVVFAGAKSPLLYLENGNSHFIKGTNNPVGGEFRPDATPYKNHEIQLKKGQRFYMYSDGFQDQFGGAHGKKFMSNSFRQYLEEVHHLPLLEQQQNIEQRFTQWKADYQQLDDILILSFGF